MSVLGRAPLRPDGGLVARGARRRGLGDRLPQRRVLRAAGGRSATSPTCAWRTGSSPRAGTGSAGACAPHDAIAFHRAFGVAPASCARPRLTLTREQLLEGGARLLGDWFADAWEDPARRGWGVAFSDPAARAAYVPEDRLRDARARRALRARRAGGAAALVDVPAGRAARPPTRRSPRSPTRRAGPTSAARCGRFTALRSGGLEGQTFEIEVVAHPAPRTPVFTRGYVTATGLHTEPDAIVERSSAARRWTSPRSRTARRPRLLLELTTHEGHFLGPAVSRLVVWEEDGGARSSATSASGTRCRRTWPSRSGSPAGGAGRVLGRRGAGAVDAHQLRWGGDVNRGWVGERAERRTGRRRTCLDGRRRRRSHVGVRGVGPPPTPPPSTSRRRTAPAAARARSAAASPRPREHEPAPTSWTRRATRRRPPRRARR